MLLGFVPQPNLPGFIIGMPPIPFSGIEWDVISCACPLCSESAWATNEILAAKTIIAIVLEIFTFSYLSLMSYV
jgi:hypothetical protein